MKQVHENILKQTLVTFRTVTIVKLYIKWQVLDSFHHIKNKQKRTYFHVEYQETTSQASCICCTWHIVLFIYVWYKEISNSYIALGTSDWININILWFIENNGMSAECEREIVFKCLKCHSLYTIGISNREKQLRFWLKEMW